MRFMTIPPLSIARAPIMTVSALRTPIEVEMAVFSVSVHSAFSSSAREASLSPPAARRTVIATAHGEADGAVDGVGVDERSDAGVIETDTVDDRVLSGGGVAYENVGVGDGDGEDERVIN